MKEAIESLCKRISFLEYEYVKSQVKAEITTHIIAALILGQEKSREIEKIWRMIDNELSHDMIERYKKYLVSSDKQKDIGDFIGSEILGWKKLFDTVINKIHNKSEE